jgi:predicted 2-oxoglutarate/Fe(II)-dependent dioxygenase YbiX
MSPPFVYLNGILSADVCRNIVDGIMDGSEKPLVATMDCTANIVQVEDDRAGAYLSVLRSSMQENAPNLIEPWGLPMPTRIEGPMVLRYQAGQAFPVHTDSGYNKRVPVAVDRLLTLVFFLNEQGDGAGQYQGGTLKVEDQEVVPVLGSAVVFPAGSPHEVTPIESGVRVTAVGRYLR